ncbi:hypothetical protein NL676_039478 [Syzygium grande]|nr:hypothetical protein NL676_039478 [Syzygium grande]
MAGGACNGVPTRADCTSCMDFAYNEVQRVCAHSVKAQFWLCDCRCDTRVVECAASSEQKVFGKLRKRGTESELILKQQAEGDVPGEISTDGRFLATFGR